MKIQDELTEKIRELLILSRNIVAMNRSFDSQEMKWFLEKAKEVQAIYHYEQNLNKLIVIKCPKCGHKFNPQLKLNKKTNL